MYKGRSNYKGSFDFVPFGERKTYKANNEPIYAGYIDLNIVCNTDVHIGSGYKNFIGTGKELVYETIKTSGKPIIPGSSFKGAVRAIAAAVSNSCNPDNTCGGYDRCIVCDMFGTMGFASKVIFPDFCSENAELNVVSLNSQFPPQKKEDMQRYKFYMTGENKYDGEKKVKAEVIERGSVFTGRIFFKRLTEEQLSLLMFSMGLNNKDDESSINLKIGGYKNEGIGEVYTEAAGFKAEKLNKSPAELAEQYVNKKSANKEAVNKINYILNAYGG